MGATKSRPVLPERKSLCPKGANNNRSNFATDADEALELVVLCLYVTIRRCRTLYFLQRFVSFRLDTGYH